VLPNVAKVIAVITISKGGFVANFANAKLKEGVIKILNMFIFQQLRRLFCENYQNCNNIEKYGQPNASSVF
jgi:hypothetical protein